MTRMRWMGLVMALACAPACASSSTSTNTGVDADGSVSREAETTSVPESGSHDAFAVSDSAPLLLRDAEPPPSRLACSNDLRDKVLTDGGREPCPTGWGCAEGLCVPDACVAAEASHSSIGCDYWAVKTDSIPSKQNHAQACFVVVVANTWSTPVTISVDYDGKPLADTSFVRIPRGQGASLTYEPYDAGRGLPPNEVALLFLAHAPDAATKCPVTPAVVGTTGVLGTGRAQAFHVRTTAPVSAYSLRPYGGGAAASTSASLLLPTSGWGQEYVAVNAYAASKLPAEVLQMMREAGVSSPDELDVGSPSLDILALEDGTTVSIRPRVAIQGGPTVAPAAANEVTRYVLRRGEYVQLTQHEELTGSSIVADRPIGVWGAASCLNVPVDKSACDTAHQQLPPVSGLGNLYVGVRHANRLSNRPGQPEETPPWRLVGVADGTRLTWEPSLPPGAPDALARGQVAEFTASGPFIVRSQDEAHPFYFAQYMTSASQLGERETTGDPEWVNVVPVGQWLSRYVLFADPTFPVTNLVVTRRRGAPAVTLDCLGTLDGWSTLGEYEFTRVPLTQGNYENVGKCSTGRHEMQSAEPFGVVVWGWGDASTVPTSQFVSYAYPGGAGTKVLNAVELKDDVILR